MYALSTLAGLNFRRASAQIRKENETNRECSYAGNVDDGIVLHSAKKRSTVFVGAGVPSKTFLAKWFGTNSQEQRNSLVESYFAY
jgi:hypothetical protein